MTQITTTTTDSTTINAIEERLEGLFNSGGSNTVMSAVVIVAIVASTGYSIKEAATLVDSANRVTFHFAQEDSTHWAVTSFLRYEDGWDRLAWTEARDNEDPRPMVITAS